MGPETEIGQWIHGWKHRTQGESFEEFTNRHAASLQDSPAHFREYRDIVRDLRFLPGGRIQAAMGSARAVTPYNCYVMNTIPDSMEGILKVFGEAVETMRRGGGVGYDFSTLRPYGDRIKTLDSSASGPVSFMSIFDAGCKTIASAGHRRGAQMGVLRVDHPDIERFIHAKQNDSYLTAFNVSVAVTDEFMSAVQHGTRFDLKWEGERYGQVDARSLWEQIMRSTWDWAEPGVIFIDQINHMNNLRYCEDIAATNPCGEQPLPPYGACLLGSFNMTKYIIPAGQEGAQPKFNINRLLVDIPSVVRAMDNVIDRALYPLERQEQEALSKRRMGLGVTGMANALEYMGLKYGTAEYLSAQDTILAAIRDTCYMASVELAEEKGPFPLFNRMMYCDSGFIQTLPESIVQDIGDKGIRNSHLLSIAPTGTISLGADNVSSGIEPLFSHKYERTVETEAGPKLIQVEDYGYHKWGTWGKSATECTAQEHVDVLLRATKYVDSAVSKTCNVDPDMEWDDFKNIYMKAWEGGAKGCTTFNPGGKRFGILKAPDEESAKEATACYIDPDSGERSCDS